MQGAMQARVRDRDVPAGGIELLASAVRTVNGSGVDISDRTIEQASALLIVIDVTAQGGTTPTLDVVIQAKIGANYVNLARFSQYGAATGPKGINVKRDA